MINRPSVAFRATAFVGVIRKGVRLKRIDDLVKQTVVEYLEIPIRYDKNILDMRIALLQSANDHCAGLIKIALTAVQENLDPVLYRCDDRLFNIRFFHLVTISVADEKSGFLFVCHNLWHKKSVATRSDYAKKYCAPCYHTIHKLLSAYASETSLLSQHFLQIYCTRFRRKYAKANL